VDTDFDRGGIASAPSHPAGGDLAKSRLPGGGACWLLTWIRVGQQQVMRCFSLSRASIARGVDNVPPVARLIPDPDRRRPAIVIRQEASFSVAIYIY
jgi:hypothetical protein